MYKLRIKHLFKLTTYTNSHNHRWMANKGYTTTEEGHRHKINHKKMLAMPAGKNNHIHRLIKRKKAKRKKK